MMILAASPLSELVPRTPPLWRQATVKSAQCPRKSVCVWWWSPCQPPSLRQQLVNRIAAALACGAVLFAPLAHADPTDTDTTLICALLELGRTPGDVAEILHESAPTFTRQRAFALVWETLPTCPND